MAPKVPRRRKDTLSSYWSILTLSVDWKDQDLFSIITHLLALYKRHGLWFPLRWELGRDIFWRLLFAQFIHVRRSLLVDSGKNRTLTQTSWYMSSTHFWIYCMPSSDLRCRHMIGSFVDIDKHEILFRAIWYKEGKTTVFHNLKDIRRVAYITIFYVSVTLEEGVNEVIF